MSSDLNPSNPDWKHSRDGSGGIKDFPCSTVEDKVIRSKQRNKSCNTILFLPLLKYLFPSYPLTFLAPVKVLYIFSAVL